MTLSTAINGGGSGGGASARSAKVTNGATGVVATISTGLKSPLTVARDSGSTSITFAASGNKLTASIASALAVGSSLSAIARVTQADGAGVLIPVTLTGTAAAPTLSALTLSATTATVGTAATINIVGATAGSTITGSVPDGMTLNSGARTITGTPTTAGTYNFTLTETLAGATNTPNTSNVTVTVAASGGAIPLRTIAVQNRVHTGKEGRTGMDRCVIRWPIVIGADASEAVLWFHNWVHNAPPAATGNAIEILDMSLMKEGATSTVPVTFSGARNLPLADGANDILSDTILPSAFGLTQFTKGETYWVKGRIAVPATGNSIPNSQRAVGNVTGSQASFYNSTNTTVSSTDATGVYTATGTAFDARANGYCPLMLGKPLVDGPSFFGMGDSIMEITGDTTSATTTPAYGFGFFQRAMHDAGTATTNLRPSINCARVGITASSVNASTFWNVLPKYCKYAIEELATNDIGTSGATGSGVLTTMQTNLSGIWTVIKNAGCTIYRTNFLPRTTSTNSWIDKAGQTPSSGWAADDRRDQLNTWFDTKVADGTLAGVIDTLSVGSDPTDNHYWLTDGTTTYATSDGTHPKSFVHELMAGQVRTVIASLT